MKFKILERRLLGEGKFLQLRELTFTDDRGRRRQWESCDRSGEGAAAFIVAVIEPAGELLLVRQFRPPVGKLMLEFPAGLIDPGETPEETAVRELYEETGYTGNVLTVSRPAYSSPGLTGESLTMVTMKVDGSSEANRKAVPHPEDTESIEVFRVNLAGLADFIAAQEADNVGIDPKIYTLLWGRDSRK